MEKYRELTSDNRLLPDRYGKEIYYKGFLLKQIPRYVWQTGLPANDLNNKIWKIYILKLVNKNVPHRCKVAIKKVITNYVSCPVQYQLERALKHIDALIEKNGESEVLVMMPA